MLRPAKRGRVTTPRGQRPWVSGQPNNRSSGTTSSVEMGSVANSPHLSPKQRMDVMWTPSPRLPRQSHRIAHRNMGLSCARAQRPDSAGFPPRRIATLSEQPVTLQPQGAAEGGVLLCRLCMGNCCSVEGAPGTLRTLDDWTV